MLEDIVCHLNHVMAWPGYAASCLLATLPSFSRYYQHGGVLGVILDRYLGHGYMVSWLLVKKSSIGGKKYLDYL